MHTHKKLYVALGVLSLLTLGTLQSVQLPETSASLVTDCVGKPYGTAGCPVKSLSNNSVNPSCGNGVVDSGEECDYGKLRNGLSNCTTSCKLLYCGDQVISPQLGEECEPDTEEVYAIDPSTGQLTTEVHYLQASCGTICLVPTCDAQGNCAGGCKRKFLAVCPVDAPVTIEAAESSSSVASVKTVAASSVAASSVTSITPITPQWNRVNSVMTVH